ncbi:MAG: twitching motility protein PilT, partial [Lachnospiraceae bacterium]|nr:twitching motility protein PilT [Lachnospiraceae bacterium]
MVQLIVGEKGKGKTKHLLDKVNSAVKTASGNIVYLDKNSKHMYELKNAIRLIDTSEYPISNTDEFMGFICGIVSQDHDIEEMYLDSFRIVAFIDDDNNIECVLDKLVKIS